MAMPAVANRDASPVRRSSSSTWCARASPTRSASPATDLGPDRRPARSARCDPHRPGDARAVGGAPRRRVLPGDRRVRSSPSRASARGRRTRSSGWRTAYVDSTAVALMTGSAHTYMRGHGLLQELERRHARRQPADLRAGRQGVVAAVAGRRASVRPAPGLERDASGRPGPGPPRPARWTSRRRLPTSHPDPDAREARGRVRPAADDVERAAALLRGRERPVIVAGGGVIPADARAELSALAERLGAPVVTTWNGKGAIDETHELAAQTIGDTASTCGNELAASADVILSVGNRFTDWSASSYRARRHLRDPADAADPGRHRSARDRQELPGRGRRSSATPRAALDRPARRARARRRRRLAYRPNAVLRGDPAAQGEPGSSRSRSSPARPPADDDGPRGPRGPARDAPTTRSSSPAPVCRRGWSSSAG